MVEQEFHGKIVERGHTSPDDIHHHTALFVDLDSTARDNCGNGSSIFRNLSPKIKWASFPVPVYIDNTNSEAPDPDVFTEVVKDSLFEWEQHAGRQFFRLVPSRSEAKITIGWERLDGASNTVAVCEYSWNSRNEYIRADISFDTSENWTVMDREVCGSTGNAFDIQNVLTHELGHGVGFDHNNDPLSCMYPSTRFGETLRRTLSTGDELGFRQLYESTAPPPPPPPITCPPGQHLENGICVPDVVPPSPLAKIVLQSGSKWVDTFYQNISGQFLSIAKIPVDAVNYGPWYAKHITISGKTFVYTYFYRTNNLFATLGRVQIS